MYFLDANAFYSFYGRSKLGFTSSPVNEVSLRSFLKNKDVKLPTSVFMEIITHFRNKPHILKDIIIFRNNNRISLYNNIPDYCVTPDELDYITIFNEQEIQYYANNLLRRKIEIECNFITLFYEISRDLYAYYKIERTPELSESNKQSLLNYIGRNGQKKYVPIIKKDFKEQLINGYNCGRELQVLKKYYIDELNEACRIIDVIVTGSVSCKNPESDIIADMYNEYQSSEFVNQDKTMDNIVDILSTDTKFLNVSKIRISNMLKKTGYTKTQILYLRDVMLCSWFDRGQKLRKNDIFDMFCVGCLDYKDVNNKKRILFDINSYLISFDNTMKEFIGTINPYNCQMINNI